MPNLVNLGYAVTLPPRRAIAYFKSKGYNITWDWFDAQKEAHTRAFTVAKATRLDLLQGIRNELQKALDGGLTEREFITNLEPILRRKGWWSKQVIIDPDGGAERVQLGSPHRLKTIYRTNMNTSYAAGRYQQFADNVESRPYWQYISMDDAAVRPEHAALNGKVFRYDDPFWDTHWPPNGWNCRCRVRSLTADEVKSAGLKVENSRGRLKRVEQQAGINKRTGEVITIEGTAYQGKTAAGKPFTLLPDAGWSYNPGKTQTLWDANGGVPDAVLGLAQRQHTYKYFALPALADTPASLRLPLPDVLPKAANKEEALAILMTALVIPRKGFREIETPQGLDNVIIRKEWINPDNQETAGLFHLVDKRSAARERYVNYILPTLEDPLEVWLTEYQDGSFRRRFIALFEGADKQSLVVARENKDGALLFNFVPAERLKYLDDQRAGFLLYRKKEESQ